MNRPETTLALRDDRETGRQIFTVSVRFTDRIRPFVQIEGLLDRLPGETMDQARVRAVVEAQKLAFLAGVELE